MEEQKSKIKDQILHLLKMRGAQTAIDLAEQLQVSPMAIRQHLQHLKAQAWVTYQEERRSLGRPVKLWQLTDQTSDRFPDSHADLMVDLLRSVETVFGQAGLEQLVLDRSQRQIQTYQTKINQTMAQLGKEDWQTQVNALAQLRSQEGYMAEVIAESATTVLLIENHCPICVAAQTCQKLCGAELSVFQTLLGSQLKVERIEHILSGDRRCVYRVSQLIDP